MLLSKRSRVKSPEVLGEVPLLFSGLAQASDQQATKFGTQGRSFVRHSFFCRYP